jgi:hypothetical protein
MEDETINLDCPHCRLSHTYLLRIKRSPFLFGASGITRRFTRLFTCPREDKDFESVLEMKEDDRGNILEVVVMGIVENAKKEKKK